MPIHRYFLPDFVEIQRESFFDFLKNGLLEEFSKRNPITNNTTEIIFHPEYFCLTKPNYSIQQAIFFQKSYLSKLYMPVQYTDKKRKLIFFKWVLIAQLPLMTKRGHFVLNGAARVLINQLVRSPGVYFRDYKIEIYFHKWASKPSRVLQRFYADIICLKGTWVRITIDKDFCMWVRLKKGPKIPLLWFLLGLGLNEKMIFQSVISPNFLLKSFLSYGAMKHTRKKIQEKVPYSYISTTPEAWKEIAKLFQLKKTRRKNKVIYNAFFQNFSNKKIQPNNFLSYNKKKNIGKIKEKIDYSNLGRKWFFQKFMNPRTYDLGKKGRLALNQKLGFNLSTGQTTLTAQDLLFITDYLMKVEKGIYPLDDIDHLKNKRIRSAGELIQMQFGIGLMRLEKSIRLKLNTKPKKLSNKKFFYNYNIEKLSDKVSTPPFPPRRGEGMKLYNIEFFKKKKFKVEIKPKYSKHFKNLTIKKYFISFNSFIQPKFINGALKEFFGTHPLSQFMDQINPLSEITHKRRLTSLGPGGVARDRATLAIRGIHPSHYGRICPIETPEGKNTGLVNSITVLARVNQEGFIESPFYSLYKGQLQLHKKIYLSADQEENFQIATPDLKITNKHFLPQQKIPVRFGEHFFNSSAESIRFMGISAMQMISVATSLIPFLEHDDANRALMGSNMQRQAVPLIRPDRPLVGTGLETKAVSDSGHALTSSKSGFILYVSGSQIILSPYPTYPYLIDRGGTARTTHIGTPPIGYHPPHGGGVVVGYRRGVGGPPI